MIKLIKNFLKTRQLQVHKNTKESNFTKKSITFRVDELMFREVEGCLRNSNLNRQIIFKTALYNYMNSYKMLKREPFELGHWLDETNLDLSTNRRYSLLTSQTLLNEFNRLNRVYTSRGIPFSRSHFIRCALINYIENMINEEIEV